MKVQHMFMLMAATAFFGCNKAAIKPNKETTLQFNQVRDTDLGADEFTIQFSKLVEESRCEPGTNCVWEGQAAIELTLDNSVKDTIGVNHMTCDPQISYKGHTIYLLGVEYSGGSSNWANESKCEISIRIE